MNITCRLPIDACRGGGARVGLGTFKIFFTTWRCFCYFFSSYGGFFWLWGDFGGTYHTSPPPIKIYASASACTIQ